MLPTITGFKTPIFNTEFLILQRSFSEFAIKTIKRLFQTILTRSWTLTRLWTLQNGKKIYFAYIYFLIVCILFTRFLVDIDRVKES